MAPRTGTAQNTGSPIALEMEMLKIANRVIIFGILSMAFCPTVANAWQGKKTLAANASQWRDIPLIVVDCEVESRKNVFGLEGGHALVVPIPERVVILPVVENFYWQENIIPLAIVDPIVLDNPTDKGLKDLFASLELKGQTVASCYLFARGHAPGIISSASIDYHMQTRSFKGCQYYARGLWRLPFSQWEALRKDLIGEMGKDKLILSHGWDIIYPELDVQIAATNVLAGNGFSLGGRRVPLMTYEAGTILQICFTKAGCQTLREALLGEYSPETFRAAEQLAKDLRKVMETKEAAEKAQREQAILQRVHEAVADVRIIPDGKVAGERRVVKLPGGTTMTMVWCPPGNFWMGSPQAEERRQNDETLHKVILTQGFWIAQTEVTQKQWQSVMGNNPSPSSHRGENRPVECVSWFEALSFCLKTGQGMQLPTESQWEYACRAGSAAPYAGTGVLDEMGWYLDKEAIQMREKCTLHPVGEKTPNAWGVYDMHGNVMEWCVDVYDDYPVGTTMDPSGPIAGERRIVRGGSYGDYADKQRSASRFGFYPYKSYIACGFRPVIVGNTKNKP